MIQQLKGGDLFTQKLFDTLNNVINKQQSYLKQLPLEGNVFVDKTAKIPKRALKAKYPNLKQVSNPDLADFTIVGDIYNYNYNIDYGNGSYIGKPLPPDSTYGNQHWFVTRLNNAIDLYNSIVDKKLIDYRKINLNDDKQGLTPESAANITNLLASDDLEIFKMGYQLLMNHDYAKEKDLFFLCIARASSRNWYYRQRGIATEKIIKEIKKDYKNIKF